jgi:hypothetical protein
MGREIPSDPRAKFRKRLARNIDAAIRRAVKAKDVRITELACEVERLKAALDTWTKHRRRD